MRLICPTSIECRHDSKYALSLNRANVNEKGKKKEGEGEWKPPVRSTPERKMAILVIQKRTENPQPLFCAKDVVDGDIQIY